MFFQNLYLDWKTVSFFLKISKEIGKAWRKSIARAKRARLTCPRRIFSVSPQSLSMFSASFQTFCLTARPYLNTQKYGLFCSLVFTLNRLWEKNLVFSSIDSIWIACMSMYIFSRARASGAILSNFFEKQWTQNHPQYLSSLAIVDRAKGVTLLPETGLLHITGALYISVRTKIHKMYINKASAHSNLSSWELVVPRLNADWPTECSRQLNQFR